MLQKPHQMLIFPTSKRSCDINHPIKIFLGAKKLENYQILEKNPIFIKTCETNTDLKITFNNL